MGTTCHSNTAAALLLWLCLPHQSLTSLEHLVLDEPGEKYQPGYSLYLERQQYLLKSTVRHHCSMGLF